MRQQLDLFASDVTPPTATRTVLTCAYGEPWIGPHPLCYAAMRRDHLEWLKLVEAGVYDAQGYTPNERKAQQRRRAKTTV